MPTTTKKVGNEAKTRARPSQMPRGPSAERVHGHRWGIPQRPTDAGTYGGTNCMHVGKSGYACMVAPLLQTSLLGLRHSTVCSAGTLSRVRSIVCRSMSSREAESWFFVMMDCLGNEATDERGKQPALSPCGRLWCGVSEGEAVLHAVLLEPTSFSSRRPRVYGLFRGQVLTNERRTRRRCQTTTSEDALKP